MLNHQHIYSTLRSALVDRDRDPSFIIDNAVTVVIGEDQFALKQSVPSGALLVAYSLLFRPGFLQTAAGSSQWWANGHYFLGGDNNPSFPILANDVVAAIAIAVGVYAGLIQTVSMPTGVHMRPNFQTAMVRKTLELMTTQGLNLGDSKELFINMMQTEEFRLDVPVADDFIANAFIAEFGVGVESSIQEVRRISADFGEL